jgi:hypothetical protein
MVATISIAYKINTNIFNRRHRRLFFLAHIDQAPTFSGLIFIAIPEHSTAEIQRPKQSKNKLAAEPKWHFISFIRTNIFNRWNKCLASPATALIRFPLREGHLL